MGDLVFKAILRPAFKWNSDMCRLVKNTFMLLVVILVASTAHVMAADQETVLATVNGTEITTDQIEQLPGLGSAVEFDALDGDRKGQVIIGLINRQLVLEQAKKEGFDQTETMIKAIHDMAEMLIVKQYLVKVAAGTDLGEEAVEAIYEEKYLNQPEEYQIAHILLVSEQEALEVVNLLQKGMAFPDLAKSKSRDKVSAEKGGDLGWLTSADMLPAFFETVSALTPGKINAQPTKTQFGWHVIKLTDKRKPTPQPMDQVRQSIQQVLIQDQISTYLGKLRDSANIEIR